MATGDVGNVVHISGGPGFPAGWYTIVSVSVGSVTWTLDRNCTTGVASGATGAMGGALATLGGVLLQSSGSVAVPGNIIWMTGTLTITATISWTVNAQGNRISIRGYGSTRGDSGHALVTCSTNSVIKFSIGAVGGVELVQVDITDTASVRGDGLRAIGSSNASLVTLQNCVITGCAIGINGNNGSSTYLFLGLYLIEVEIKSCTTAGVQQEGAFVMKGCYCHGNAIGVQILSGGSLSAYGCVFSANTTYGVQADPGAGVGLIDIQNCDFYSNTSDGFNFTGSSTDSNIYSINNIFYGNGGYGINIASLSVGAAPIQGLVQRNNFFGSNTSGNRNTGVPAGTSDVSLTANPFNSPSTGDFSLNSTTGGGAAVTGAGWQSAII